MGIFHLPHSEGLSYLKMHFQSRSAFFLVCGANANSSPRDDGLFSSFGGHDQALRHSRSYL